MSNLPDDFGSRLRSGMKSGAAPELSTDLVTGAADHPAPKLSNPRRTLQVVGGATGLVAVIAVAAVVASSAFARPPLFTEAASSSANGAAVPAAEPVSGLFRIWADYVYHAGANLSTSGGSGDVYQLVRSGSGSDRAESLAGVFGLSGDATVDNSDPANPLWTVGGSTDSTEPSLQLTWSGAGDWWYNAASANPAIACPPTVGGSSGSSGSASGSAGGSSSSSGGATTAPNCAAISPPAPAENSAPTGDDARSKAQAIFAQTGLNVATSDISVTGDSSGSTASANLVVGGEKTALDWQVSWSGSGEIYSANGESVTAVDRGSYGTISAADAVQRLSNDQWSGEEGPKYQARIVPFAMLGVGARAGASTGSAPVPGVATAPNVDATPAPIATPIPNPVATPTPIPVPTDLPTGSPTSVATPEPTSIPTPEPTPTGPPIINVTIHQTEPTLLLVWDSNGDAWLVPGYAMKVENGWWDGVVSLVPGVIALPPVSSVEPVVGAP